MNIILELSIAIRRKLHNIVSDKLFSEIFTGSIWASIAQTISVGFSFIFNIVIARKFGAEVIGIIAILNSFLMFSTIVTVLGTGTSILRLIPEHIVKYSPTSAFNVYRKTQYLVIGISIIFGFLLFYLSGKVSTIVFSKPYLTHYIAMASFVIVFKSIAQLNTNAVRGLKLIKTFAFMNILPQLSNVILLLVISSLSFSKDAPVYALFLGFVITGIIGWLIMTIEFKKRMKPIDNINIMPARAILSISTPMLMNSTMGFIMAQTGVIMLGIFRSDAEVGYYGIAVKLATITTFVLSAINSMAAPKFSELFHSGQLNNLFHVAKKSAQMIFWITAPILIVLLLLGRKIIVFCFGIEFSIAYHAMIFLIIGQFINSISGSTGYFMNMTGNQIAYRNILFFAVVINVSFNYLLIPKMGISGSAIASMSSTIFWNIITLFYIKVKYGKTTCYLPLFAYK